MTKQSWIFILLTMFMATAMLSAQEADTRTLFSVEGTPVTVDEFTYIYSKTNGDKADFSEASLQEYLDLYVKFKLKVERAKEMRLDTIVALQDELAGYRRQLADSYLVDRAIGDRLIQEAYDHSTQDVDISHILFAMKTKASPEDTLVSYRQAIKALERIRGGEKFEEVAQQMSMDKYSKNKGGHVGYITAMFPKGLHNLEYAAYTADIGTITGPVRTSAGYHLVRVNDRRPARGEIEANHILIRAEGDEPQAKTTIDSIYQLLENGADFRTTAKNLSQDTKTTRSGGYLGFFGISRYEKAFEDAAFSISDDDAYSEPVRTKLGWHIIQRISRKEIQPFYDEKPRLEGKVRGDSRFEDAKAELLQRIRRDNKFAEQTPVLDAYINSLPDTFVTFRWKPGAPSSRELFRLGDDYVVTLGEFSNFLGKATRDRVTYAREGEVSVVARRLYNTFIDDQLLKYEETQLENRYPEFKSLMREYEEGILLFEATKLEVWDKASQDSVGLVKFHAQNPGRYTWGPRANITTYRIGMSFEADANAIREYARRHSAEAVKEKFNTDEAIKVVTEESVTEKIRNAELSAVGWEAGSLTGLRRNEQSRSISFIKIDATIPDTNKTLDEARGYVIADYQDYLESQWVKDLRAKYAVKMNERVFKSLIK